MEDFHRINGTGTTLLGISKVDENNIATATKWFTLFWLPLIPLSRHKVKFINYKKYSEFYILSQENLNIREILKTYLFCWFIIPGIILGLFYISEYIEFLFKKYPYIDLLLLIFNITLLIVIYKKWKNYKWSNKCR